MWNYRAVKYGEVLILCEVYYDEEGLITGWVDSPSYPYGENASELLQDLEAMQEAMDHPILRVDGEDLVPASLAELLPAGQVLN